MNPLERAIAIALQAHAGEVDKTGKPYVLHPLRLMLSMETEEEMVTAVLHDVVEDSSTTIADLAAEGFPDDVLTALELLTHDKAGTPYENYIANIKHNPLARRVKLADLKHNMDLRRLPVPLTMQDWGRLEKYRRAYELLATEE